MPKRSFIRSWLLISASLFCLAGAGFAQITRSALLTAAPRQYEKAEWEIALIARWENPYLYPDISLDMELAAPSGKILILPCYYLSGESGGESKWQARFTPQEPGSYDCRFILKKGGQLIQASQISAFSVSSTSQKGFLHPNDAWTFRFDNGERFRGIGENIGWEARSNDDSKFFKALHENPRFNYEYMLSKLAAHGGNFMRTWMCSWNLPLEWKQVIDTGRYKNSADHFNPGAIERMDQLVELADSLGVYIMLTIEYPGSFGGRGWAVSSYNRKNGGPVELPEQFFSDAQAKMQFKSRLRYLVARWGYSSSIAAWEFFNEIDNVMFAGHLQEPIKAEVITKWHDEMSSFLKSIDPYGHLVTTSISHRDVEGLNSLKNIDFNQKHIYKNTLAIPSTIRNYLARGQKPYVIGEFAYEWDWSKNFDLTASEFDVDFKRGLWLGLFSPTPILPMTWWWEYFDERGMTAYYSRVREIYNNMMNSGHGEFAETEVAASAGEALAFGVRCGEKVFIYLLNPAAVPIKTGVTMEMAKNGFPHVQSFSTETGIYSRLTAAASAAGKLTIPGIVLEAGQDVILVVFAQ